MNGLFHKYKPYFDVLPSLWINNPWRKANIILYVTNRCNSKCVICNLWQQQPKYDLPLSIIEDIIYSKSCNKNSILLEGGETILHPNIEEILWLFHEEKINYTLLTNGLLTKQLVELTDMFDIPNISISLDGRKDTYINIRGIDGYDNIIESINKLEFRTNLTVCYTAIPSMNTYEDYLAVKQLCKDKDIRLMFNIYSETEFNGHKNTMPIDLRYEKGNTPYVKLYNRWLQGKVNSTCLAMRFYACIRPNGDIDICTARPIKLGNLHHDNFDKIWKDQETRKIQQINKDCNMCWVSCNRHFDSKLWSIFHR